MELILFESFALAILMVPLGVAYLVFCALEGTKSKANQLTCAFFAVEMCVAMLFGWFPVGYAPGGFTLVLRVLVIVAIIVAVIVAVRGFKTCQSAASGD